MKTLLLSLMLCTPVASLLGGTFATINPDGDFSDWASVPIIATDSSGDGSPADFLQLQAANDDDYLYLRFTLASAAALNSEVQVFISIDNDNNTATGFDVYGLGLIGSEVAWQNDFPFQQSTGVFNTGGGVTDGAAGISPFFSTTDSQEIRISRNATFTTGGGSIFPNDTIGIAMYSNGTAADDFIGTATYTFASAIPEPSSVILILSGFTALIALGRIRRRV